MLDGDVEGLEVFGLVLFVDKHHTEIRQKHLNSLLLTLPLPIRLPTPSILTSISTWSRYTMRTSPSTLFGCPWALIGQLRAIAFKELL